VKHLAAGDLFNVFAIEQGPRAVQGGEWQAVACFSDLNDLCPETLTRGLISAGETAKSKPTEQQQQHPQEQPEQQQEHPQEKHILGDKFTQGT